MADQKMIIMGAIGIIIGLVMLPVAAGFAEYARTRGPSNSTPVANISGAANVVDLVIYGFAFGLVGVGVGMIVMGFRG